MRAATRGWRASGKLRKWPPVGGAPNQQGPPDRGGGHGGSGGWEPPASNLFDGAPVHVEAFGEEELDGAKKDPRFEALAGGGNFGKGGAGADVEAALGNDRAFVEVHADEMGGDTGDLHAVFVGLTVGLGAGETGEEGGVDVDDLVLVAPHEVGREDLHEAGEHDEVGLVFFEVFEGLGFRRCALVPGDVREGEAMAAGQGFEVGVVGEDEDGFGAGKLAGLTGGQQGGEAMGLAGDEDSHALPPVRFGEADFDFHRQAAGERREARGDVFAVKIAGAPGGLEGHAELTAGDLFLEAFDVGLLLEEKAGDTGDDAGFVAADDGDGGEMFHARRDGKRRAAGAKLKVKRLGNGSLRVVGGGRWRWMSWRHERVVGVLEDRGNGLPPGKPSSGGEFS